MPTWKTWLAPARTTRSRSSGVARTMMIGDTPVKFGLQWWHYLESPDTFGAQDVIRFQVAPVVTDLFLGILCLFLLDMGIVAARRLKDLSRSGDSAPGSGSMIGWMVGFSLLFPLVNGALSLAVGVALGLGEGDLVLLTVLGASASYIAVPAAMRLALPEANPSTYLPMSLAITFPFNLLIGIPVYHHAAQWLLAA